jgi:GT2 family glycosyltransferase
MDLELSAPLRTISGLDGYQFLQLLVRFHGIPLGYVKVPVIFGCCSAAAIGRAVLQKHRASIIRRLLLMRFATGVTDFTDLIQTPPPDPSGDSLPLVTVAVCTRDCPPKDLRLCLNSLNRLDYPNLDIIIVDNAPCSLSTKKLVTEHYPRMRYVCEDRPGLNWARNRAILEARGDIIAFTDDDVVVDPGWLRALSAVFEEEPETMAVTGLVVPYELETETQALFERYGAFSRGFERRWYRAPDGPLAGIHGATGKFGTGANMAFRHSLFEIIGYFDPALDVGTVTNAGGDLEFFFRVLKEGYSLIYEPKALVRHRHRRDYHSLHKQITNWGIGFSSSLVRSAFAYPDERWSFTKLGMRKFYQKGRAILAALMYPNPLRDLQILELKGLFMGLFRYSRALRMATEITKTYGPPPYPAGGEQFVPRKITSPPREGIGVRAVDIADSLPTLDDATDYSTVRVFVRNGEIPIGAVDIPTFRQPIRETRMREVLVDSLGSRLFNPESDPQYDTLKAEAYLALERHLVPEVEDKQIDAPLRLPDNYTVSIVLSTYDRPHDLRNCLSSIMAQKSTRKAEIIVIDNNPSSGLTPPITNAFPEVILLDELRKGSSYARNAGIAASTGDIIITIDDDETAPVEWLETLLTPFVRSDVMVVTGNVLPMELETPAQYLFESYGGFGRGYELIEANRGWFEYTVRRAVPTWRLGGTGNAAYRASIFADPQIGMFDVTLGAGTPTGGSEDTYLFYKVLKAGYSIIYNPKAYLFHRHRSTMPDLQNQIYNYSKAHVALLLKTLFNDYDLRALVRLFVELPPYHMKRIILRLLGRGNYPLFLILREIGGSLAGPLALYKSRRRARRLGASKSYIPVSLRGFQGSTP